MALSPFFQEEIRLVAGAESVVVNSVENEAGYLPTEWSISGSGDTYTIYAGSAKSAQLGAAWLMDLLGFIFFKPGGTNYVYRPSSITRNLSVAKRTYWMKNNRFWRAYGGTWGQGYSTEGNAWEDAEERWQILTGMGPTSPTPVGHRWDGIIESTVVGSGMSMSNRAWFLANPQYCANPEAIGTSGFGNPTFQLDGSLSAAEYNILVDVVAASLLRDTDAINEFNRTHFDSQDGSTWDSATTFGFGRNVLDRCRSGTLGLGNHPPRDGISEIQLGIYAYAEHRKPPPSGDYSGLYIDIAVGFSKAGYASYPALVAAHANRYDFIGIRDFTCVQLWCGGFPLTSAIERAGILDTYDLYKAAGADGCNSENQWYPAFNLVGMLAMQRKLRTGVSDWAGALDDVVNHVYNGDPAVRELYELFADPLQSFHVWNLQKIIDIVEDMEEGWYKDAYKHCIVVWHEIDTIPEQLDPDDLDHQTASDPFYVHAVKMMKHVWAMRNMHMLDCYPIVRQRMNGAVDPEYPKLRYSNGWYNYDAKTVSFTVGETFPGVAGTTAVIREIIDNGSTGTLIIAGNPLNFSDNTVITGSLGGSATRNGDIYYTDWWMNPALPTTEEYDAVVAAVAAGSNRDEDFDSQDLVVMHNVVPELFTTNGGGFETAGASTCVFVGPGRIIQTGTIPTVDPDTGEPDGGSEEIDYPTDLLAGLHRVSNTTGTITYTHESGLLFLDAFPTVRRDPSPGGDQYVWFPIRVNGTAEIIAESRVRLRNATGTYNIVPETDPTYTGQTAANLGPGQLTLDNGNTSGFSTFSNVNRYVSLRGDKILGPRSMLEEDFPNISYVTKP